MLTRAGNSDPHEGPVGLDDRPRPASSRQRVIKGLIQSAPFSSLQRLIIFFNLLGLIVLVGGMTYLSDKRNHLLEVYVDSMRKQGQVIAASIAETARSSQSDRPTLIPIDVENALAHLAPPTGGRIRIYDLSGNLLADSFRLANRTAPIEARDLAPVGADDEATVADIWDWIFGAMGSLSGTKPPLYQEVDGAGVTRDEEVYRALAGQIASSARMNSQGELIVSVAIPIQRLHAIQGALRFSNTGGEVEQFLREERRVVIEVFLLAAFISVLLSILLANLIASPIRRLAEAARSSGASGTRALSPEKQPIPDMTSRTDEIGDLSDALIRMTGALYARIGAIESFAADVSHEIKNPLTSLRSAVETMPYAKTDEQKQKLMDVVRHDVQRMDRLLTDISNASRLDAELVRERMEALDLRPMIQNLSEVTSQQAEALEVSIQVSMPETPLMTHGLEGRLAQVITNLLTNALSFSPLGGKIEISGGTHEDKTVWLQVEDDGPGIPPENLASIFERFYSERPETEAFGGHSGLGLSISRQIVEAHGGRIWAENRPDQSGARFTVELPA
ncbi:MAG: stimulus-sensing domain-containing protein [Pseudomonadota bacterium]